MNIFDDLDIYFPEIATLVNYFKMFNFDINCRIYDKAKGSIWEKLSNCNLGIKMSVNRGHQGLVISLQTPYSKIAKKRFYKFGLCKLRYNNDGLCHGDSLASDDENFDNIVKIDILKGIDKELFSAEDILNNKEILRNNFFTDITKKLSEEFLNCNSGYTSIDEYEKYLPEIKALEDYLKERYLKTECRIYGKIKGSVLEKLSNCYVEIEMDFYRGHQGLIINLQTPYSEIAEKRFYKFGLCKLRYNNKGFDRDQSLIFDDEDYDNIVKFDILKGIDKELFSAEDILNNKEILRRNFFTDTTEKLCEEASRFYTKSNVMLERRAIAMDNFSCLEALLSDMGLRLYKVYGDILMPPPAGEKPQFFLYGQDSPDDRSIFFYPNIDFANCCYANCYANLYLDYKINPDTLEAKLLLRKFQSYINSIRCKHKLHLKNLYSTNWCKNESELVKQIEQLYRAWFEMIRTYKNTNDPEAAQKVYEQLCFKQSKESIAKDAPYKKKMKSHGIF